MGNEFKGSSAHSAEHFGDTRDYWWNLDFLQLVARRWRFDAIRDVLDVGCGVGHWGMALEAVLPAEARVTGVDAEPRWIDEASARARSRGLSTRFSYRVAAAERLPFADDSFDLTTCQTVLIHLANPAVALAEMQRVTRPGGLVAVAEPNNLSAALLLDSISSQASISEIVELVRLQLTCERGKAALGQGDNSLGDRVPGLFAARGLTDVEVFVNDKATAIFPPYAGREQEAFTEDMRDRARRRLWHWSEPETRRYFLAGGGAEHDFVAHFERALAAQEKALAALHSGTYYGILGGAFYLVAGRKNPK
jgi:SAM-dependent methyltransferase